MKYNRLGRSGLKVSAISFGTWMTFGNKLDLKESKNCFKTAFDLGINFFDTAEVYSSGAAELYMGEILKDYRREQLVISTKIFWGGEGPNDTGLSWKHLVEGTKASLQRMKLDHVDILFCHRPDPETPLEETLRAMDYLIKAGLVFYWGTSEWGAADIESVYSLSKELNTIAPTVEQPEYNLFHRQRVEQEFAGLYPRHHMGLTTWSPLASGLLTGKYNNGLPEGSRLQENEWLRNDLSDERIEKVKRLTSLAGEIGCTTAQLAIGWCLKNPNVSSVITGASSEHQVRENVKALQVKEKLTPQMMERIDAIFDHEKAGVIC